MRFPHNLSATDFLSGFWQKKPLFMPKGVPDSLPQLDADELGWLATLSDVESRLVFTERHDGSQRFRVEHGPFDDKTLSALPASDWTLLVNDVEKHLPELRAWLSQADFIPDWRVDDLMVSFAAPGGSVGPHRDNYDVFLCQGTGERHWQIAMDAEPAEEQDELSLLEPFPPDDEFSAVHRDVLYLPPGIAHWGEARSACITYSVGMRAPTHAELQQENDILRDSPAKDGSAGDQSILFYTDADLQIDESAPGCISPRSIERARTAVSWTKSVTDADVAMALGCCSTALKIWLAPEVPGNEEVDALLSQASKSSEIPIHGMARLAWCDTTDCAMVFVNGAAHSCNPTQLSIIQDLATKRVFEPDTINRLCSTADDRALLRWMLANGVADLAALDP
jgi:50S ribosomal protein L16 3-hydroxylase